MKRPHLLINVVGAVLVCGLPLAGVTCGRADAPSFAAPGHPRVSAPRVLPSLGVNYHLKGETVAARRADFRRLAAMGARWVRLVAPWYAVEPGRGWFDTNALRALRQEANDARLAGLRVLWIGDQAPAWAGGGGGTASRPAAYGAFMGMLARQLRRTGPGRTSPAYELMNEPDALQSSGKPLASPAGYAKTACAAFHAIKAADPSAVVAAGSLNATDWKGWLRSAFGSGLAGCFDVLSAHPYGDLASLGGMRAVAGEYGVARVRIWVTEFGASTCGQPAMNCVSAPQQARLIVHTLQQLREAYPWVPVAMIYEARDEPAAPGAESGFGLFETIPGGSDIAAKPAVADVCALYRGRTACRRWR